MGNIRRTAVTVLFSICAVLALTGAKHQPASSHKKPPPPLQCYGGELEAKGHLLLISPKLTKAEWNGDLRLFSDLGSQDPVRVTQLLNLFKDSKRKSILDLSIAQDQAPDAFRSLTRFNAKGKFTGPVPIRLAAVKDKNEKKTDRGLEMIVEALDGEDLRKFKGWITGHWSSKSDRGDPVAGFRMEIESGTVIGAITYHDGTQDCLSLDLKQRRKILPPGVEKASLPGNYPFELPIEPPFKVTYFYGPRIFNSSGDSKELEAKSARTPVSLKVREKGPMEFLNKYWQMHSGVDFAVRSGTPVYSPYDGVVFAMGPMGCAGNTMVISHTLPGKSGKPIFSVYEHLAGFSSGKVVVNPDGSIRAYRKGEHLKHGQKLRILSVGDPVVRGELIAHSGASGTKIGFSHGFKQGCVDGAHLHFEMRTPNDSVVGLQREIASALKSHKSVGMGKRFQFMQRETTPINPADYIYDVDSACQKRKNVEMINAIALKNADPKKIPPISAGTCGYKYESAIKTLPNIYRLSRKKAELFDEDSLDTKVAATRR